MEARAHISGKCICRDEHAALHHELGQANAAQEGGFPALVGACDDHQVLSCCPDIVANNLLPRSQRQANIK
jgi:hypothetical protein